MGEIHDLADEKPDILDDLVKYWMIYVAEFGVFLCVSLFQTPEDIVFVNMVLNRREELEPGHLLPKQ